MNWVSRVSVFFFFGESFCFDFLCPTTVGGQTYTRLPCWDSSFTRETVEISILIWVLVLSYRKIFFFCQRKLKRKREKLKVSGIFQGTERNTKINKHWSLPCLSLVGELDKGCFQVRKCKKETKKNVLDRTLDIT